MGHVLCEYNSRRAIAKFTDDPALIEEVRKTVYCSYEWALLDAGLADENVVMRFTLPRLGSDLARDVAVRSLDCWHRYNLWPKEGMAGVVADVKARGQRVYVLSNAGARLADCWRDVLPYPDAYDGIVFSAVERCLKPQKCIYEILFSRYRLDPAGCLFIDDLAWNVAGGEACGMDGWTFESGDVAELRRVLKL